MVADRVQLDPGVGGCWHERWVLELCGLTRPRGVWPWPFQPFAMLYTGVAAACPGRVEVLLSWMCPAVGFWGEVACCWRQLPVAEQHGHGHVNVLHRARQVGVWISVPTVCNPRDSGSHSNVNSHDRVGVLWVGDMFHVVVVALPGILLHGRAAGPSPAPAGASAITVPRELALPPMGYGRGFLPSYLLTAAQGCAHAALQKGWCGVLEHVYSCIYLEAGHQVL